MTDAKLYELLGRKQEALEVLHAEYCTLLGLVERLKAGEVALEHVTILPGNAWRIETPNGAAVGVMLSDILHEERD